jgi:hypothetical protein
MGEAPEPKTAPVKVLPQVLRDILSKLSGNGCFGRNSDFGRRFGWFIEKAGETVGELEYIGWDSDAQFWHLYRVTWRRPEIAIACPDSWAECGMVLRNRRFTDVVVESYLVSAERAPGVIAVRGASVPEERIRRSSVAANSA